jgi:ABC-type nitrate/sulfonate/bicarbonate transport system permease component
MVTDTSPRPSLFALRISPPRMTRRLVGLGGIGIIVLFWWFATSGLGSEDRLVSPVILPSPAEVLRSFPSLLKERALLESIAATLTRRIVAGD